MELLRSGINVLFMFMIPTSISLPPRTSFVRAVSLLTIAVQTRNVPTTQELLSTWSPSSTFPEDPLLALAFVVLLQSSTPSTVEVDAVLFRILLDNGLDINFDFSAPALLPYAFNDFNTLLTRIATKPNLSMLEIALEPQYGAIVDRSPLSETATAAASSSAVGDVLKGAKDLFRRGGGGLRKPPPPSFPPPSSLPPPPPMNQNMNPKRSGKGDSIVFTMMFRLAFSSRFSPSEKAALANGRGVEALAKLLHKGKPEVAQVEEALTTWKAPGFVTDADGRAGLELLERYLDGKPYCCDFCSTTKRKDGDSARHLDMCVCKSVTYCGSTCQISAWKEHKKDCGGAACEDAVAEAIVKGKGGKKGGGKKGGKKGKKGGK